MTTYECSGYRWGMLPDYRTVCEIEYPSEIEDLLPPTEVLNDLLDDDDDDNTDPWVHSVETRTDPIWSCYASDGHPYGYKPVYDTYLPHELIMVDPTTFQPVKYPFSQPKKIPKPYHPHLDHDYLKKPTEEDERGKVIVREFKYDGMKKPAEEDEPVVEVWEINTFSKKQPAKVPRRTSARTRIIKEKEQARKISNAVQAVLKNNNTRKPRQCRNAKPKNSVETTPSQSDIEECYSQPVRPTSIKIIKKKTSKGRIDHSESERHRREVLRSNFFSLSAVVPKKYLMGEKVTSQISKQKILNGAKAYIVELNSFRSSYKPIFRKNDLLKEKVRNKLKRIHH